MLDKLDAYNLVANLVPGAALTYALHYTGFPTPDPNSIGAFLLVAFVAGSRSTAQSAAEEAKKAKDEIAKLADEAKTDGKKIKDIRGIATRLSSGTKTAPALPTIIKDAQNKLGEIEQRRLDAEESLTALKALEVSISDAEKSAKEAMSRLEAHDTRATGILNNATQAGLAGAYKLERDKLARQQLYFALAFYGIISAVILYAAVFIVPIASEIILNHQNAQVTVGESGLLLFVRILIVLPAFWALLFTNKRFTYLETLQMNYAAKAVTALAYSGYRDELNDDSKLSTRLRDGLVTRFVEHPSRLLGRKVESSLSITGESGSQVVSESHSPEATPFIARAEGRASHLVQEIQDALLDPPQPKVIE